MKKKKNSSTPRRKRMKREGRIRSAKIWINEYEGKNIVRGYAKWYGVSKLCAVIELQMSGIIIEEEYIQKLKREEEDRVKQNRIKKEKKALEKQKFEEELKEDEFYFDCLNDTDNGYTNDQNDDIEYYDPYNEKYCEECQYKYTEKREKSGKKSEIQSIEEELPF